MQRVLDRLYYYYYYYYFFYIRMEMGRGLEWSSSLRGERKRERESNKVKIQHIALTHSWTGISS